MNSAERVVVIGGGMAGARLVQRLAAAGPGVHDVTLVGEEPHAPYTRVLLAEVLAGRYPPDVISLPHPPAVRRLPGVRAVRIDRARREVECDDGGVLAYDRLVLATGANPVLPPLRGLFPTGGGQLPGGVHPFRTLDDCLALDAAVRDGEAAGRDGGTGGNGAVVIGGGLLGVSAARALAARGVRTVLAHQGERLMEGQLDDGASVLLRHHLEGLGVEVHTECRVRGLRTTPAGAVRAVELADGYVLDAGLVVLACGVRPRTGLAAEAGLTVARGVVVDDELRTSDPRIHAVGDCAEHAGTVYGLAGPALEQADALARVLSARHGDSARPPGYPGTRALTRLTLAPPPHPGAPDGSDVQDPLDIASFGVTTPLPEDDVIRFTDATRGVHRQAVVRGDRLVGGVLLGDLGGVGALATAWEADEPLPDTPLLHLLTDDGGS
ncbi:FAD-dependent oxidoreductase [Streptomyces sp. HNM0574]|uniref:NAD(P)/FAD-dependent oxidoreductase n=1 Tax=Streptomyces sp. HNM0574 TaxID=2714954 RepID=UPI00146E99FF|nr:FAD-dependent oxidoreductase [Streptomyces sp. HNM0574]NLU69202.1 NAD(P)/FAD-dependent oxidoreductase [Streptomyces sp. HNM0574]